MKRAPEFTTNLLGRFVAYVDPESKKEVSGEVVMVAIAIVDESPTVVFFIAAYSTGEILRVPPGGGKTLRLAQTVTPRST